MIRARLLLLALAAASGSAAAERQPDLSAFAGRYVFDKVGGITFVNHTRVRVAARQAAPNAMLARQALTGEVSGPITRQGDLLLAYACQTHNCPGQNWALLINIRSGVGAVCYMQHELTRGAVWFVARRAVARSEQGYCNQGIERVPAAVVQALTGGTGAKP